MGGLIQELLPIILVHCPLSRGSKMMVAYLYRHLVTGISEKNSDVFHEKKVVGTLFSGKIPWLLYEQFALFVLQNWLPAFEAYSICWCARNRFLAFGEFLDLQSTAKNRQDSFHWSVSLGGWLLLGCIWYCRGWRFTWAINEKICTNPGYDNDYVDGRNPAKPAI